MKKTINLLLLALGCFLFVSCKPTEKGYKAAYDAASQKREAVKADLGVNLPKGSLQEVDGAQIKNVNGVDVYVLNQRIRPIEDELKLPGNFNVVVGKYKMITNCKSQCDDLVKEGYKAFPAKDHEGLCFTVAGSFSSLEEAVTFYQEYKKGKDRVYVGLPESPVIIYSPK